MSPDRESQLKLYSLGIVMENKADGSDQIKVYPVEELPFINGNISDFKDSMTSKSQNAKGVATTASATADAVLIARWFCPGGSNRMTPPDVVKNETVQIYRYADTDEYYWTTIFREPELRRLETVCYMFGNLPDGLTAFDKSSSYWFEISTKNKNITVKTTKSNNEPYEYTINLDTQNGNLVIQDDIGNIITFDSPSATISAVNSHGASISMSGDNLDIYIPGTIKVTSGGSSTWDASDFTLTSQQNTANGTTDVNGVTNLNQGMNVKGDNGGGKAGTLHGDFELEGSMHSTGTIDSDSGMTAPIFNGNLNGYDLD